MIFYRRGKKIVYTGDNDKKSIKDFITKKIYFDSEEISDLDMYK